MAVTTIMKVSVSFIQRNRVAIDDSFSSKVVCIRHNSRQLYLTTSDTYMCHEAFSFIMSIPAMSLRDKFCVSRKDGGEYVHPMGENSMAMSKPLLGAR